MRKKSKWQKITDSICDSWVGRIVSVVFGVGIWVAVIAGLHWLTGPWDAHGVAVIVTVAIVLCAVGLMGD